MKTILFATISLSMALASAGAEERTVVVPCGSVKASLPLKSRPSATSAVGGLIDCGKELSVIEEEAKHRGWLKVRTKQGLEGFIESALFASKTRVPAPAASPAPKPDSPPATTPHAATPPITTPATAPHAAAPVAAPATAPSPAAPSSAAPSSAGAPSKEMGSGRAMPVGRGVSPPSITYRVEPQFTDDARQAGIDGTVTVSVVVDADGNVRAPKVVKGLGYGLDESAMEAVSRWKFRPGMKDGVPVPVYAQIEVTFRRLPN